MSSATIKPSNGSPMPESVEILGVVSARSIQYGELGASKAALDG